ncbi:hypothetical protein Gotur_020868 [Gossypium turneri]
MEKTLSALWKRLETLYATKSLANRLVLKQHLFTFRMNEGGLLRYHISQFITLLNDLKKLRFILTMNIRLHCYCALYTFHTSLSRKP